MSLVCNEFVLALIACKVSRALFCLLFCGKCCGLSG